MIDPAKLPAKAVEAAYGEGIFKRETVIAAFLSALMEDDEAMTRLIRQAAGSGNHAAAGRAALLAAVQEVVG